MKRLAFLMFGALAGLGLWASYGASQSIVWRNVGPGGGGWIQALACDPHNPDILYLGCDVGGFYISFDAGRTWQIRNEGLTDFFVECIAVHPQNSNILLLGCEGGIFKSTNQGRSWEEKRTGFPAPQRYSFAAPIGALCFDPVRPHIIYAGIGRPRFGKGGQGAIYKSEDEGETWRLITSPGALPAQAIVSDLEVAPNGSYVLAATDQGLFRSLDGGQSWQKAAALPVQPVEEIAIAPSAPQIVYVTIRTTARDSQPWNGGVWRSTDGGLTWERRSQGLATRVGKANESAYMTSNYKEIVVHPQNPELVYVGDRAWVSAGIYKTTDGGLSWRKMTQHTEPHKNMDYGWLTQWGPSVECLALSLAQPQRLVFGTSGHVFLTDDGGERWQQRYCHILPDGRFSGNGLEVTCLNDIIPDPLIPGRIYFCYMDIGLLISEDGGETFRTAYKGMKAAGNCFTVARDPEDKNTLWAATGQWGWNEGYICRSRDGGQTWELVGQEATGLPSGQIRSLIVDPTSPRGHRRLWAACQGYGIYRSEDDGTSWRCVNNNLPLEAAKAPVKLLLDPAPSGHLRLALRGHPQQGSGLYETLDGGQTWRKIPHPPIFYDIRDIAADPQHFDTLFVCLREHYAQAEQKMYPGGLYCSLDGGQSWRRLHDFHFASCVAISPQDANVIYLGTTDHPYHDRSRALGLLVSRDGGKTWQAENMGLSHGNISCVRVDPRQPQRLYLGTGGNGAFIGEERRAPSP